MKYDIDKIIGEKRGTLTVLAKAGKEHNHRLMLCVCECGKIRKISIYQYLKRGYDKCICRPDGSVKYGTHGLSDTPIYKRYQNMIERCYNKNNKEYPNYGGRGIIVCEEWKKSVVRFYNWAISNGWDKSLQLDRINVNGNYEPENCRWATAKLQCRNKRNNRMIEYLGDAKTMAEWCEVLNLRYPAVNRRCNAHPNLTGKELLEYPYRRRGAKRRIFAPRN